MTENGIKVGNYEFSEFNPDKDGGRVIFKVRGREGYTLKERDKTEVEIMLGHIGKWEEKNKWRDEETGEQIKRVYFVDYETDIVPIICDDGRRHRECFRIFITHKNDLMYPMENFWTYIKNAIKWKQLLDTRSNLRLGGTRC
ncbi:MAG: hypothetical protein NWE89_07685 [Candidatus Bathyarchaeota archaeon]|nr:hypothetical protein [Candidatus Bathyarchaeota archaeon]